MLRTNVNNAHKNENTKHVLKRKSKKCAKCYRNRLFTAKALSTGTTRDLLK